MIKQKNRRKNVSDGYVNTACFNSKEQTANINILRKIIFAALYIAYAAIYIARLNLTVASPLMVSESIANTAQIGVIGSIFSIVYALGRMINGYAADKIPPHIMLAGGLVLTAVGNYIFGMFPPYAALVIMWGINAFGQSMLWSSVLRIISEIYPKESAKQKTSYMITSVAIGNILGIVVNSFLITYCGVRFAFIVPGTFAIIMSVITYTVTKNIKNTQKTEAKQNSKLVLPKDKNLLLMNIAAMIHGVMKENICLWMAVYIVDTYFVDLRTSSYYILLIPAVGLAGRFLYPVIYRLCRNDENKVSLIGFAICAAASILVCASRAGVAFSVIMLSVIYMAVSLINTSMLSIFPLSYAKTGNTASVGGIIDFSTYLGAGISSAVYGVIIKRLGYFPMFVSWAVISVFALVIINGISRKNKLIE